MTRWHVFLTSSLENARHIHYNVFSKLFKEHGFTVREIGSDRAFWIEHSKTSAMTFFMIKFPGMFDLMQVDEVEVEDG